MISYFFESDSTYTSSGKTNFVSLGSTLIPVIFPLSESTNRSNSVLSLIVIVSGFFNSGIVGDSLVLPTDAAGDFGSVVTAGASVVTFCVVVVAAGASVVTFDASVVSTGAAVVVFGASVVSAGASVVTFGASVVSAGADVDAFAVVVTAVVVIVVLLQLPVQR